MANWCDTQITITCDKRIAIRRFDKLLEEWTSKDCMENGFGAYWLGNIVVNSGIGTTRDINYGTIQCRGKITNWDISGNEICITTETARSPMLKMWAMLIDKYLPGATLTYVATEIEGGLYVTNIPEYKDKWVLDVCDVEGLESDYEIKECDLVQKLQKAFATRETDINKLIRLLDFIIEDDQYVGIHKWEIHDENSWY